MLLLLSAEIDLPGTFPVIFSEDGAKYFVRQHKQLVRLQKSMFDMRKSMNAVMAESKFLAGKLEYTYVSAEMPGYFAKSHEHHREFVLLNALLQSNPKWREKIALNYCYLVASLSLQNRLETYLFFQENRAAINRARQNIYVDQIGRSDLGDLFKAVLKFNGNSRVGNYDAFWNDLIYLSERDKQTARSPEVFEQPGLEFEKKCHSILQSMGFDCYLTRVSGDYGADIIAEKGGLKFCLQCKDWSRPVGIKAIQEVASARSHFGADFAVLILTSSATRAAHELASTCDVKIMTFSEIARIEQICY